MPANGMTILKVLAAIGIGLVIAFVYVFATAPHPVSVPVQTITPVPTPPPVVITETPTVAQPSSTTDMLAAGNTLSTVSIIMMAVIGITVLMILLVGNNADSLIPLIITFMILGALMIIMPAILNAIIAEMPVVTHP